MEEGPDVFSGGGAVSPLSQAHKVKTGEVSSCAVPFSRDLAQFDADYLRLTRETAER